MHKSSSLCLGTMTSEMQRYFGDWVRFEGYGGTGYYLDAKFVRYLLRFDSFDEHFLKLRDSKHEDVRAFYPGKTAEEMFLKDESEE